MKETAMTRMWSLGALIVAVALLSSCGEDADKAGGESDSDAVVLTLANPDDSPFNLDEFAREVESQSDGSLRIEFRNAWRSGEAENELGTIEDVRDGKVDMGGVGVRAFDLAGVDTFQPLVAPFAIDSYSLEGEVLDSPLAERMLSGVEKLGLVGVALLPGELRKPLGISRPLLAPSDYRGAAIGIRPSELAARSFEALGATTEGYHPSGNITSFDGVETSVNTLPFNGSERFARTLAANVSLWPRVLTIIMNREAYGSLSDDQREAIAAAGHAALEPSLEEIQAREDEAIGILCNRGELAIRQVSQAQLDGLRAATTPVSRAVGHDPATREAAEEIAAMRAEIDREPPPACIGQESATSTGDTTPVDGLWQMQTTRDEAAAIIPESDLVPENWGDFVFAFRAGRFAFTTESQGACIWAYGTYSLEGDNVEWNIEDGGGETPNDAANAPGEVFRYRWSRYRDQLTLEPVPGEVSPEPFRVEPWRLLEGEPSIDALSNRCPPPADALEA
jgi:TRAP-type C4-dicarboxylate transport system substrate-binding protein